MKFVLLMIVSICISGCFNQATESKDNKETAYQEPNIGLHQPIDNSKCIPNVRLRNDQGIEVFIPVYCGPIENDYEPDPEDNSWEPPAYPVVSPPEEEEYQIDITAE